MRFQIQPPEIEVPEDDPLKNDLLGRRETVEVLTGIVRSIEGPCVLSVDAAWGAGKTTFLRIWAQYLRNEDFPVVEFNAWETDFAEEPFIALSNELTEGLKEFGYADGSVKAKINDMTQKTKEVVRSFIPGVIKSAVAAGVPLVGGELGQALASLVEEKLNAYEEARKSIKTFRSTLQEMANTLSKSKGGRPLVVVIDELDRCRPSYAVELLEVAKHIFAVNHVVFVLGVNRSELAHSVKALYGNEFDASGYLGRFFDLDFRLPEHDRSAFINAMLAAIRIDDYYMRTKDEMGRKYAQETQALLQVFFVASDLSLRKVAQAIYHLGLVYASLRSDQLSLLISTAVAMILRTIDTGLYHRFVQGEVSDSDVVDAVFNRLGTSIPREKHESHLFEAVIIAAAHEGAETGVINSRIGPMVVYENGEISSPLLRRYQELINGDDSDDVSVNSERKRARTIIDSVRDIKRMGTRAIRFKQSVQRIELLSTALIAEEEEAESGIS